MPGKMALLDYRRCDPAECPEGVCVAALACPRKVLVQEAPFEAPMAEPGPCRGCGDCVRACPRKALQMTQA